MASEAEIANLALTHIGVGKEIANLETEKSQEAAAIRRVYDNSRDQVLRNAPWPFATKTEALALVEETPDTEYLFTYRYPVDCIYARRILSGIRNDTRQTRVTYKIERDDDGLTIRTDQRDAELEYTFREEDPVRYPSDFVNALSLLIAAKVAPRLTAGDPFRLGERAMRLFMFEIDKARAAAADEQQPDELPPSEFIIEREGGSLDLGAREDFNTFFGV